MGFLAILMQQFNKRHNFHLMNGYAMSLLGWLRSAVLVVVWREHWGCATSTQQLDSGITTGTTTAIDRCLRVFYMNAVWPYFLSTCVCMQICIFISRRCYFKETSPKKSFYYHAVTSEQSKKKWQERNIPICLITFVHFF